MPTLKTLKKLLLTTLLSTATLFGAEVPFENNFCDNVNLTIPTTECESLEALWDSTGGDNWTNKTGWGLDTEVSKWFGVYINDDNTSVRALYLPDNNLTGSIPSEIGNIINLDYIGLEHNNLTGNVPITIDKLTLLTYLNLIDNQLSGSLPTLTKLINLKYLQFYLNNFIGNIPVEYGQLTKLEHINLSSNKLSGAIPNLSKLDLLDDFRFGNNRFIFSDIEPQMDWIEIVSDVSYENQHFIDESEHDIVYFDTMLSIEPSLPYNANDLYTWRKDVDELTIDAERIYSQNNATKAGDEGLYRYTVKNSVVTRNYYGGNLILYSYGAIQAIHTNTPVLTNPTPLTQITENELYTYTSDINDSDVADELNITLSTTATWLELEGSVGGKIELHTNNGTFTLSGTPTTDDIGSHDINITVTDGKIPVHMNYLLVVKAQIQPNNTPAITGTPSTEVNAGELYTFTPTGSDSDGDTLTYSITNKPSWATFDEETGELTGTPQESDVKSYENISITVSDSLETATLPTFNINVKSLIIPNTTPTIAGTPNTIVNVEETYTFTPTGSDTDGDTLSYSIINKPSWASFSTVTGALTGTPQESDVGTTNNIVITVSDATATASLPAFDLEVKTAESVTPLPTEPDPDTNTTEEPASSGGGGAMGLEFLLVLLLMLGFKRKGV